MTTPAVPGRPRRRRRRPKPAAVSPLAVLSEARAPALDQRPEVPMSVAEVARMKGILRFLREHRHTLKLKVNAAEDLLLNGKREPTHRGVCQHLLSKLDRTRVLQASERMPPAQATEFLAGIVRFAPEVPYVLRFLECVKASEPPRHAAAVLTQALERLDFSETSQAQLRDLLQLVVDIFPASELPAFAFSLLSGAAFRQAFDRSSEGLPASLLEVLLPLRGLHQALSKAAGQRRPERAPSGARASLEQIRAGACLMLGASRESLLELPEPLRRQLFRVGCDALGRVPAQAAPALLAGALSALFRSLEFPGVPARSEAVMLLGGALLRVGLEQPAAELLRAELEGLVDAGSARHWLAALGHPRLGNVALEQRARRGPRRRAEPGVATEPSGGADGALEAASQWQRGLHLPTQREVLVRVGEGARGDALLRHAELFGRALLPGVPAVVEARLDAGPEAGVPPYLALEWKGPALPRRLRSGPVSLSLVLGWCREACLMLAALAAFGLELPDAALGRFSVDAAERLWLADLWQVRERVVPDAASAHLEHARTLIRELLASRGDGVSSAAHQAIASASSLAELCSALSSCV